MKGKTVKQPKLRIQKMPQSSLLNLIVSLLESRAETASFAKDAVGATGRAANSRNLSMQTFHRGCASHIPTVSPHAFENKWTARLDIEIGA